MSPGAICFILAAVGTGVNLLGHPAVYMCSHAKAVQTHVYARPCVQARCPVDTCTQGLYD